MRWFWLTPQNHLLNVPKKAKAIWFWKEKTAHTEDAVASQSENWRNYFSEVCQGKEARFPIIQGFPYSCQSANHIDSRYWISGGFPWYMPILSYPKSALKIILCLKERKENREISKKRIFVDTPSVLSKGFVFSANVIATEENVLLSVFLLFPVSAILTALLNFARGLFPPEYVP